ncbi:MAG TPA: glycosyltransferase family 1 protein [Vicinamibacterales bacterium]|nr:glycosyltransferase family 1 protein [Vicinamibacterales bacterium]
MRILIDYRAALRERTGVGEYVHQLASALVPLLVPGDELTLFSSSWKDRLSPHAVPGASVVDARVPVRLLNYAWHRFGFPPVDWLAGHHDIVQALHPLLIPARAAARFVTIHDLDFLDHPERTRAEIRRDYAALAPAHARRADRVVTVSGYTASEIVRRLGVDPLRIVLCPPGAPAWTPRHEAPVRGPILFMGTLEARKNVGVLLDAYARLRAATPDAPELLLAGHAPPAAAGWLSRIAAPPLAGYVRHLGYVAGDRRQELYRSASMLVLPSLLEGFGLPVLEAMTIGVPVVVSDRGALPEVAGDAGQIVAAEDPDALAAAMERYLSDSAFYSGAVNRGLTRARQYSWRESAATLLASYTQAAK